MIKNILKITIFSLFSIFCIPKLAESVVILPTKILPMSTANNLASFFSNVNELYFFIFLNIIGFTWLFFYILAIYCIAKIFGIFKLLDNMYIRNQMLMVLFISLLLFIFCLIFYINSSIFEFSNLFTVFCFLPAWLLRKLFNFLTKKFPTPFKQIGYFFSLEFYKDLYKKLLNKSKSSN